MKNSLMKKYYIIPAALILLSLAFSLVMYISKANGQRRSFIFPSVEEGRQVVEIRYVPKI